MAAAIVCIVKEEGMDATREDVHSYQAVPQDGREWEAFIGNSCCPRNLEGTNESLMR